MTKFLFLALVLISSINTKTVIVGDSISAYAHGWQETLCRDKNLNCNNLSVGGKRTDWMLKTLSIELKKQPYTQAIIYGGINDIFSYVPTDTVLSNVQKMVDLCNRYNVKPIVIIGYDSKVFIQNTWIKDKKIETMLRDRYIDYQRKLNSVSGAQIVPIVPVNQDDSADGIHLSSKGHKTFANWFKQYF